MVAMTTAENLVLATQRVRESAHAVGHALASVTVYAEPSITRAVQAEQNLYARIEQEFGMLTSTEAGKRMGSRSRAPRNFAATPHSGVGPSSRCGGRRAGCLVVKGPPNPFKPAIETLPKGHRLYRVFTNTRPPTVFNPGPGTPTRFGFFGQPVAPILYA